jgi:hypothetical protein
MAATPAARAAFLATRLTFGSRVFFVFADVLAFVVFLVFDLVRARFDADLTFMRLTLFFMIPSNRWRSTLNGGPEPQCPRRAEVPFADRASARTRVPTEAAFYRLKRAKYLVCNIYDATLKIIAVAKVKANIVIHICSSIAWQAGARTVSQPPAPGLSSSRWTGRSR